MHWLLSVPESFSLREAIKRSRWLLESPFYTNITGDQLHRIEYLSTGQVTDIRFSRTPAGLVVRVDGHLSAQEIEEISQKAWRLLRLEDSFDAFRRTARRTAALTSVVRIGARLIRGATLLEDAVTAVVAQRHPNGKPDYEPVSWVVDRLGHPLPTNPTLHAFPTGEQLTEGETALLDLLDADIVRNVLHVARVLGSDRRRIQWLIHSAHSANDVAVELAQTLQLRPDALSLLMLSVGRYDYIPTDTWARHHLRRYQTGAGDSAPEDLQSEGDTPSGRISGSGSTDDVSPADVRCFFEPWQPWGGLAYWLWDWTKVPASSNLRLRQ